MGKGLKIGATIGMFAFGWQSWKNWQEGGVSRLIRGMTGYGINSGTFNLREANALLPLAAGLGVSFVAAKTGVNRFTPKGVNI
ncbi:unnamed protein product [marine sediment metagenome]|uniref:Uncharacterized protein n=1 Tax=marine sediment metagenome TaxID=412755 RepID=X1CPI7_9ZZZZ